MIAGLNNKSLDYGADVKVTVHHRFLAPLLDFTLFLLGLAMQGRIYKANGGDILDILGFIGDVGAGGLYVLTLANDWGQGAIAYATADYGTKFMIVAGLLNFIAIADAYHIAIGKKQ